MGEEKEAKKIAVRVIKREKKKRDTKTLVNLIEKQKKRNFRTHGATKVFQALRIFVNQEISELIYGLIAATKVLKKDGVLVVVTFHSIEKIKLLNIFLKGY